MFQPDPHAVLPSYRVRSDCSIVLDWSAPIGAPEALPVMWGFLIGLYIAVLIYPFIEEWQQRRIDRSRLAKMRAHHATGHRWDVAKGQWSDE
jgi:hypothetical protein